MELNLKLESEEESENSQGFNNKLKKCNENVSSILKPRDVNQMKVLSNDSKEKTNKDNKTQEQSSKKKVNN